MQEENKTKQMKVIKRNDIKDNKAITLVALVVTIIVLIILAGVSISLVLGHNGILTRARDGRNNYQVAANDEHVTIASGASQIDELVAGKATSKIDYGEKTALTVGEGDEIIIGATEKFKVLKRSLDGNTIIAIPYYNLKLSETTIKQATAENAGTGMGTAGLTSFWSGYPPTWGTNEDINLDTYENNIKKYIEAYQETIRGMGINNVTVRIARYQEMYDLTGSNESSELRNPTGIGYFWMGTTYVNDNRYMWMVQPDGSIINENYREDRYVGVRPVIEIHV